MYIWKGLGKHNATNLSHKTLYASYLAKDVLLKNKSKMLLIKSIIAVSFLIGMSAFVIEAINQANEDAFLREKERQNLKKEYEKSNPK